MHLTSRGLLCVGVLIVTMSAAAAQSRATGADIRGHVQDASGGRLAAAAITARNRATNIVRDVTTDAEGNFVLPALEPGEYDVRAQHEGFSPAVHERLAVQIGELVEVTFALDIAPIEQTVRVEAGAPVVNPSQTAVSTIIGASEIEQLPLNGRRFLELAALAAGVTTGGPVDPAAETSGLSVLGQRPVANNLMVDGFDNNDRILGGPSGNFSQEAIREFQVLTSSYPAEFGNATGGVVNIVTRSGSNSVHGTAFLYNRNTALNARGYFEQFDAFGTPVDSAQGDVQAGPVRRIDWRAAATRSHVPVCRRRDDADPRQQRRDDRSPSWRPRSAPRAFPSRPAWCRTSRTWASWWPKATTTGGRRTA